MKKMNYRRKGKQRFTATMSVWLLAGFGFVMTGVFFNLQPAQAADVVVYKSPTCGCCTEWVKHMKDNGFNVEVHNRRNMNPIKTKFGVPNRLQSCHTAKVGDYVVEGHVPADTIARLLKEKPDVKGLTVPGMPMGSPGMEGPRKDPYDVLTFQANGRTAVYDSRNR